MTFTANYYTSKFQAGLQLIGQYPYSKEPMFIGTKSQWAHAEKLENGDHLEVEHVLPEDAPEKEIPDEEKLEEDSD